MEENAETDDEEVYIPEEEVDMDPPSEPEEEEKKTAPIVVQVIQNIVILSKSVLSSLSLQTVYFRIKTKDLSKELLQKPTLILLIFDNFGQIFDFWRNLGFSDAHF